MKKKPSTGYEKKSKKKHKKKNNYIGNLFVFPHKKISFNERIIKFLIYISLRIAIRPKKWKSPEKNYEIIDRTYKRIVSSDFVFIPSSIAFYLIMAFMPIMIIILVIYQIPVFHNWFTEGEWIQDSKTGKIVYKQTYDALKDILSKFIPGISSIIEQATTVINKGGGSGINVEALTATIISLAASSWIAAGGFAKLVFTQSYIYEHKFLGGYWANKIKGMTIVIFFSLFLFCSLLFNIFIHKKIDDSNLPNILKDIFTPLFLVFGLILGIFIGFLLLYKFSPRFKIKFRHIIPGAMVTTLPTSIFFALFGYISSLWSYGNYGIIGTFMYIGMGSLIITYFIFIGIITNAAYYKTFVGNKVKTKWTLSKK